MGGDWQENDKEMTSLENVPLSMLDMEKQGFS